MLLVQLVFDLDRVLALALRLLAQALVLGPFDAFNSLGGRYRKARDSARPRRVTAGATGR